MKTSTKIVLGTAIVAAVALITVGVVREVKKIKKITIDVDDAMPEDILFEQDATDAEENATV